MVPPLHHILAHLILCARESLARLYVHVRAGLVAGVHGSLALGVVGGRSLNQPFAPGRDGAAVSLDNGFIDNGLAAGHLGRHAANPPLAIGWCVGVAGPDDETVIGEGGEEDVDEAWHVGLDGPDELHG